MSNITVITASLPSRPLSLAAASLSVSGQSLLPAAHFIGIDHKRIGTGAIRTMLADVASTKWIATLDDDDFFDPGHLATLYDASDGTDIVYSWCRCEGRDGWNPNREFSADDLRRSNFIPATALIRRDLIGDLGGWRNSIEVPRGFEDWDFWLRALEIGATFKCVPEITWTYRFHGGNKTFLGEKAAY